MRSTMIFNQDFDVTGGDFINAGVPSCTIRSILMEIGVASDVIRRVAIAAYEAEMNVVMYAHYGVIHFSVYPDKIFLKIEDKGPGIKDIELAMEPGYSTATEEMREMGFGAGMGLPNIKKNADNFYITSTVGKGTRLEITINLNDKHG
jgi:anti-sigma regulatory factor (Ser/Thr protein kinase)